VLDLLSGNAVSTFPYPEKRPSPPLYEVAYFLPNKGSSARLPPIFPFFSMSRESFSLFFEGQV